MNLLNELKDVTVTEEQLRDIKDLLGIEQEWRPKHLEEYWSLLYRGGEWLVDKCVNRHQEITDRRFDFGLVFKTKEQAQEEVNKRNFLQQMELDFKKNSDEIDWDNENQIKHNLIYKHKSGVIDFNYWFTSKHSLLVTTNLEWLEQYIRDNEEDIKKYYFGVEV